MNSIKTILGAMMVALAMGCLSAQSVIVTFMGTANDTANGYTAGQPVTFHFVINDGFGDFPATWDYGAVEWYETNISASLYAGVGGTGINGMFMKPMDLSTGYYQSEIYLSNSSLSIKLWYWGGANPMTGISAPNMSTITAMDFNLSPTSPNLFPSSGHVYQTPESLTPLLTPTLSSYGGTYALTESTGYMQSNNYENGYGTFTLTSMTIMSMAPIPEPAAFAACAGLLALGFAGCRRRPRC